MPKDKQEQLTLTSHVLLFLLAAGDALTPWMNPYEARKRALHGKPASYRGLVYRLYKKGWIKAKGRGANKTLVLTKEGILEALLIKAILPGPRKWDGKWRLVIYDIPEAHKDKRHYLRYLLKRNNFFRLQGSVYISPYPLNRAAITYLKETKLINFIRIMKVEELDDDTDLKRRFHL